MSSDQDQLCVVDSDTGQILYYFNPDTGEMKWVNQPPKEIEMSKEDASQPPQLHVQNNSKPSLPPVTHFTPASMVKHGDHLQPLHSTMAKETRTQIKPKECSNFISGEVVTVLLEPCANGNVNSKVNKLVGAKQGVTRNDADKYGEFNAVHGLGSMVNGVKKKISRKRKQDLVPVSSSPSKKITMPSRNTSSLSQTLTSPFQCRQCDKQCTNKQQFALHVQTHQKTANYRCPRCYKRFPNPNALATHAVVHVLAKPYLCGECDKSFTSEGGLAVHMAVFHVGVKPYSCQYCTVSFAHACALTEHLASHLGQRSCRCNYCHRKFPNTKELSAHLLTHASAEVMKAQVGQRKEKDTLRCGLCKQTFHNKKYLELHINEYHQKRTSSISDINPLKQLQALIFKETPTFESRVNRMKSSRELSNKQASPWGEMRVNNMAKSTQEGEERGGNPLRQLHAMTYRKSSPINKISMDEAAVESSVASRSFNHRNNERNGTQDEGAPNRRLHKEKTKLKSEKLEETDVPKDETPSTESTKNYASVETPARGFSANEGNDARHIKIVRCHKCDKIFASSSELARHSRIHLATYTCTTCEKVYQRESDFKAHLASHDSKAQLKCPKCTKTFIHSHGLNLHLRVHTGEKPFTCKHCGKAFAHSGNMTVHLRTHTGEKPYQCEYCQQAFNHSSNLKNHMRLHTGEKPYKCKTCGRTFSRSSHLRNHVINHTLEKSEIELFRCDVCDKAFEDVDLLTEHLKTHNDTRPHQCQYCGKAFSVPSGLAVHLRTHTGEKPYHCEYCSRAFSHSSNLKVHVRTHTGEKPYRCPTCQTMFARSSDLRRHVYLQGCSPRESPEVSMVQDLVKQLQGTDDGLGQRQSEDEAVRAPSVHVEGENSEAKYLQEKGELVGNQLSTEDENKINQKNQNNEKTKIKKRRFLNPPLPAEREEVDQGQSSETKGYPHQFSSQESSAVANGERYDECSPVAEEGGESSPKSQPPPFLLSTLALKPKNAITNAHAERDIDPAPEAPMNKHTEKALDVTQRYNSVPALEDYNTKKEESGKNYTQAQDHRESAPIAHHPIENSDVDRASPSAREVKSHREPIIESSILQPLQALAESVQCIGSN